MAVKCVLYSSMQPLFETLFRRIDTEICRIHVIYYLFCLSLCWQTFNKTVLYEIMEVLSALLKLLHACRQTDVVNPPPNFFETQKMSALNKVQCVTMMCP
jgi:hypothetical protein